MRKALILILMACLLPSCRSGKAAVSGRSEAASAAIAQGEEHAAEGRYDAAVIAFTQALEVAGRIGDRKLLARCYYDLSETCNCAFFYEEGLSAADSAWQMSLRAGIPSLADSARYQQALSLIGLEEYPDARIILDSLLTDSLPALLASRTSAAKAFLAVEFEKDPEKALPLFEQALSLDDAFDSHEYWAAYAYCLAAAGQGKMAESLFAQMEESGYAESAAYQAWRSRALALQGNWAAAFQGMDRAASRQRSATSRIIRQASFKAQRDYLVLENKQSQARERARTIIAVLAFTLLSLLLAAAILFFRERDKKNREERTELLAWASSLEEQRNNLSAAQAKIRSDYARIYQSYFQQIGRIREIVDNSPEKEKGVYYQLNQLIKDIRLDRKGQYVFETQVNRDLDDIMKHFREEFPKYHEDTYRFISYVFAGFDATTIRLLTGMASDAAVHTKKSGIKRAILASSSTNKDQYLLFL